MARPSESYSHSYRKSCESLLPNSTNDLSGKYSNFNSPKAQSLNDVGSVATSAVQRALERQKVRMGMLKNSPTEKSEEGEDAPMTLFAKRYRQRLQLAAAQKEEKQQSSSFLPKIDTPQSLQNIASPSGSSKETISKTPIIKKTNSGRKKASSDDQSNRLGPLAKIRRKESSPSSPMINSSIDEADSVLERSHHHYQPKVDLFEFPPGSPSQTTPKRLNQRQPKTSRFKEQVANPTISVVGACESPKINAKMKNVNIFKSADHGSEKKGPHSERNSAPNIFRINAKKKKGAQSTRNLGEMKKLQKEPSIPSSPLVKEETPLLFSFESSVSRVLDPNELNSPGLLRIESLQKSISRSPTNSGSKVKNIGHGIGAKGNSPSEPKSTTTAEKTHSDTLAYSNSSASPSTLNSSPVYLTVQTKTLKPSLFSLNQGKKSAASKSTTLIKSEQTSPDQQQTSPSQGPIDSPVEQSSATSEGAMPRLNLLQRRKQQHPALKNELKLQMAVNAKTIEFPDLSPIEALSSAKFTPSLRSADKKQADSALLKLASMFQKETPKSKFAHSPVMDVISPIKKSPVFELSPPMKRIFAYKKH